MVDIHPFAAIRPEPAVAQSLAAVPYDVVTAEEVRHCIEVNPLSFLRVSRSDAELPGLSPHDPRIYERARSTFQNMLRGNLMVQDNSPSFYIYRVNADNRIFTGIITCVKAEDYLSGLIHRHELTQYEKEEDRTRHIEAVNAQTGLVFLVYRDTGGLSATVESLISRDVPPDSEVVSRSGARHQIFRLQDPPLILRLKERFEEVKALYIADGHHRAAAAVNVALRRQSEGHASPESLRFMAVLFAHHQVMIHGYSRLVTDLGGLDISGFIDRLKKEFKVDLCGEDPLSLRNTSTSLCMYLSHRWYTLTPHRRETSMIDSLDVTILQEHILCPILGISDPRKDSRLHYYGGVHSIHDLEEMVDSGKFAVAFAMRPVDIETVMAIADQNGIMPPKSTWFEPKLLSGLLVHSLE
jgi:uncharacterized protein (DUF1015 family)